MSLTSTHPPTATQWSRSRRIHRRSVAFAAASLAALAVPSLASCGWSPKNSAPQTTAECSAEDTPTAETLRTAIEGVGQRWTETARGHTGDCRLHWVVIGTGDKAPDAAVQVLFFDRNEPLGPPTPRPRPYTTVVAMGDSTAAVQYQWLQGEDKPCCPTGIGQVRFQIGDDGSLKALDPIPGP
ncbi:MULTISPECIES: LppP/LprE family lipoprotein [Mycobacteriaceae]|uniref:LppP/LprE family lipoprotein n=1 Tax=Mycobacteriaceae TaxID=1762 RepID=UPI000365E31C|nr:MULTISPECIES: LppP/LprE family lipoprotein [Mycobacteriaceae]AXK74843.1 LppP/LprE family lipoprotein [Mycolicibacterium neoaurum]MDO3398707.1 LppP/LprE family lipoprotein [Mycolicibacterium neoaurum]